MRVKVSLRSNNPKPRMSQLGETRPWGDVRVWSAHPPTATIIAAIVVLRRTSGIFGTRHAVKKRIPVIAITSRT